MLFAPAICERCSDVFASHLLIAEHPGEAASYRGFDGPCPRCGSRGAIPEWVFRFHAVVADALQQATPDQVSGLYHALSDSDDPSMQAVLDRFWTETPDDPWRWVISRIRHAPADQRQAHVTLLKWMLAGVRSAGGQMPAEGRRRIPEPEPALALLTQ